jgi:hypothetical protein
MGDTDDEVIGVVDGQVAVNPVMCIDSIVNIVLIRAENHAAIVTFSNLLISILNSLSNEKPNWSVALTDECHNRWFVLLEVAASFFENPRSRPSSPHFLFHPL